MKKAVSDMMFAEKIEAFSSKVGGVFSTADLFHLAGTPSSLTNQRAIRRLVQEKILSRCQRGFYVTKKFDLWTLAGRMGKDNAYVSMDSALSKNGLMGTLPGHLSVVTIQPRSTLPVQDKLIRFYSIKKKLFFGFSRINGILTADNEKAYLDLLYYYTHGHKFIIDPTEEINLTRLDRDKIKKYLKRYKNPKFVSFVKGLIDEQHPRT